MLRRPPLVRSCFCVAASICIASQNNQYPEMKRREFLTTSLAASALAGVGHPTYAVSAVEAGEKSAKVPAANQEYFELRAYRLKSGANHDLLDAFLEKAAIPALNRLGIKPVGVFTEMEPKDPPSIWTLIPYASLESFSGAGSRLNSDGEYQKAGADYLQ